MPFTTSPTSPTSPSGIDTRSLNFSATYTLAAVLTGTDTHPAITVAVTGSIVPTVWPDAHGYRFIRTMTATKVGDPTKSAYIAELVVTLADAKNIQPAALELARLCI